MRILSVTFTYLPSVGGIERSVQTLSEGLARRNHRVAIVTPFICNLHNDSHISLNGTEIFRLPFIRIADRVNYSPGLLGFISKWKPDVIHMHGYGFLFLMNDQIANGNWGAPCVLTGHGGEVPDAYPTYLKPLFDIYNMLLGRTTLRNIDKFVVETEWEIPFVTKLGVPANRIFVSPPALDINCREVVNNRFRTRFRIGDRRMILCVSRFHPKKGQTTLISAMKYVVKFFPDAIAVFVGPPNDYLPFLKDFSARIKVTGNITFIGHLEDSEKYEAISTCDLFVLPSSFENFGISIAEAMFFGKPIVATSVGAIPFVIDDGVNGFLVPPNSPQLLADKIIQLLQDEKLRTEMGIKGLKKARNHYMLDRVLDAHEALYAELMTA